MLDPRASVGDTESAAWFVPPSPFEDSSYVSSPPYGSPADCLDSGLGWSRRRGKLAAVAWAAAQWRERRDGASDKMERDDECRLAVAAAGSGRGDAGRLGRPYLSHVRRWSRSRAHRGRHVGQAALEAR